MDKNKALPAKGKMSFPLEEPLRFDVEDKMIVTNPNFLLRFNRNEFTGLRFRFNFGVTDTTFKYLDQQQNLKLLDITGCYVSSQVIDILNKLPKLEELKVSHTNLIGQDLIRLKRLSKLKLIHIAKLPGQAEVLKKLKGTTELEQLRLSGEAISPQDLSLIAGCRNLRTLWIEKATKVTDKDVAWITKLQKLQEFYAMDAQITYKGAVAICQMPNLKVIGINYKVWSKADVARLQKAFPKIVVSIDKPPAE